MEDDKMTGRISYNIFFLKKFERRYLFLKQMQVANKPELMNKYAFIIQMLVRNYLENENVGSNVHMYSELINDVDVFNTELENIEMLNIKFKAKNPQYVDPKSIKAFLELRDFDDEKLENKYVSSIEVSKSPAQAYVKYCYELMFKDVLPILMKVKYPTNTTVQIIYVSSDTNNYKQPIMNENITTFNNYKEQFLGLTYDEQYMIVNNLLNDNRTFSRMSFIEAVMTGVNMLHTNSLKQNYKNNVSDEEVDMFINNLAKCSIREFTLEQLVKQRINPEQMLKRELGIYN